MEYSVTLKYMKQSERKQVIHSINFHVIMGCRTCTAKIYRTVGMKFFGVNEEAPTPRV